MAREAELVGPRFARGCRCYAVLLEGAVAGYGWLSTGPEWIGELQLEIRPQKGEAYIWNCVTLESHRRKGIFRSLVAGISEGARQTGLRRVWIGSVAIPGEKALPQSGFQRAAHFRSVAFAGLFVVRASYAGTPYGSNARRVLPLRAGLYGGALRRRKH